MTKPVDPEALRQEADKVRQRVVERTVSVPEDSGVRGQLLTSALAKAKRRRLKALEWRGLEGARSQRKTRLAKTIVT